MTSSTQAQRLNFQEFVTFQFAETDRPFQDAQVYDVQIDQSISIDWNEPVFSRQLGISRGLIAKDEPLLQRIQFLENVTGYFFRAQQLLVELKAAASRLESAKLANSDSEILENRRKSMLAASNRFATEAATGLELIDSDTAQIEQAADKALRDKVKQAILGDYKDVADVLTEEIDKLNEELMRRVEQGESIQIFMEAWITGGGAERPLHLDGYDKLSTGRPTPFQRFQLALPERTTRELESAQRLGELVTDGDEILAEVKAAIAAIKEESEALSQTLRVEVLQANLKQLAQNLRGRSEESLSTLTNQATDLVNLLQTLVQATKITQSKDTASVSQLINDAIAQVDGILRTLRLLPGRIETLVADLERLIIEFPDVIESEIIQVLRNASEATRERPEIQGILTRVRDVQEILGFTNGVAKAASTAGAIGRNVGLGNSLDTSLQLLNAGERHPGDMIIVSIRVVPETNADEEIVIAQAHQRFKLRVFGFYVEPRGSLLFVDPESNEFASQSFEPAVALSFMGHVGFKGFGIWNDFFDPGVGLTFSFLDFEDKHDFELGISGSFTIFRDLLWLGYGRNLQAKENFVYVGVNPLAFGDLLKKSNISAP